MQPPMLLDPDLRRIASDLFPLLDHEAKISAWFERERIELSAIAVLGDSMVRQLKLVLGANPQIPTDMGIRSLANLCFAVGWEAHRQVRGERARDGGLV